MKNHKEGISHDLILRGYGIIISIYDSKDINLFFHWQNGKITSVCISDEKIPSEMTHFDFTWYPFDTQHFMVPYTTGIHF